MKHVFFCVRIRARPEPCMTSKFWVWKAAFIIFVRISFFFLDHPIKTYLYWVSMPNSVPKTVYFFFFDSLFLLVCFFPFQMRCVCVRIILLFIIWVIVHQIQERLQSQLQHTSKKENDTLKLRLRRNMSRNGRIMRVYRCERVLVCKELMLRCWRVKKNQKKVQNTTKHRELWKLFPLFNRNKRTK